MPRRLRCADGGYVYHVLNRAVGRATLFRKPGDYAAFEKILNEAWERSSMRLLAYAVMPNHWHLVVWPDRDGALTTYLQWLTVTHVRRWHAQHHTVGTGPIYQGRFKSFPIQEDDHFLTVCRYVERNPRRAGLVRRAEAWRWSSLWHREQQTKVPWLTAWPVAPPADWRDRVKRAETEDVLQCLDQDFRFADGFVHRLRWVWRRNKRIKVGRGKAVGKANTLAVTARHAAGSRPKGLVVVRAGDHLQRRKANIFQQSPSGTKARAIRISLSRNPLLRKNDALKNIVEKCWFVG